MLTLVAICGLTDSRNATEHVKSRWAKSCYVTALGPNLLT